MRGWTRMVLGGLCLIILPCAGFASAQLGLSAAPQIMIDAHNEPLIPQVPVSIPVRVDLPCPRPSPVPSAVAGKAWVNLSVMSAPAWLSASMVPPSQTVPISFCTAAVGSSIVAYGNISVVARAGAPAFEPSPVQIQAKYTDPLQVQSGQSRTLVTAQYEGGFRAIPTPGTIRLGPCMEGAFGIELQNFANADTRFALTMANKTGSAIVILPAPLRMGAAADGTPSIANLTIPARTACGDADSATRFSIRIQSAYALDPKLEGPETLLALQIDPVGGSMSSVQDAAAHSVPASGAMTVVAAVAGVGLALARRRNRTAP
ncbi:MAG: hypothetical protein ACYDDF_03230 [Thermoplasmatota archaeon]